jgi:AI-2 transport protein TqsA
MNREEAWPPPVPPANPTRGDQSVEQEEPPQTATDPGPAGEAKASHRDLFHSPTGLLLALACMTIVLFGMRYSRSILAPIFLAMFVVMGLSPILQWLRRRGMPPWAAIIIVLVGFLIVALLLVGIIATSLGKFNTALPVYQENLSRIVSDVQVWFAGHGVDIGGLTSNVLRPEKIIGWIASFIRLLISLLTNGFLIILIVAFMIAEVYSFPRRAQARLSFSPRLAETFKNFGDVTRTFLFTLTWVNMLTAVIVVVVYYAFGVDFALLWGLMFFLLSFIPNIGFVLSVIPPFFVTLLEFGFTRAIIVVVIVIFFNGLVNNAVTPRFMGQKTGLSTLAVFLSLVLWAWVLGPIGALMSVPLMLMVKLLFFDSYESTRPLSALISPSLGLRTKKKKDDAATTGDA